MDFRSLGELVELLHRAPGFQPIADIAVRGQTGKIHYLDRRFGPLERSRYLLRMSASRLIVVRQDVDGGALKVLRIFVAPFAGTMRIACGGDADGRERINIFFALDNKDRPLVRKRLDKLRKPIENAIHTIELPDPAASTIESALPKVFRLEP